MRDKRKGIATREFKGHTKAKSKKAERFERKQSEQNELKALENTITHRFIDLTAIMAQKAIGKNLVVENLWWTTSHLIVRCQYNF